ncbi:MAG: ATP-binding protein [Herbinix sp.]|jgi:anti-sigma regulatory factor (Ser/Thr protein kinase)|nr:ATP-binding protein [Herbinix sp.]
MITLSIPSRLNELDRVLDFVNIGLEVYACTMEVWQEIQWTVQTVFLSIIQYAYPINEGIVKISLNYIEVQQAIEISFFDQGVPYNPLESLNPSLRYNTENYLEGGVGISVLENSTDKSNYIYLNRKNVTTIKKYLR